MPVLTAPLLDEARENLRVIRQVMERSTKYSTLSGLSGVLIGLTAIAGVLATRHVRDIYAHPLRLALIWLVVLALAVAIDFARNKRRAAQVGKRVVSPLGAHILIAALPAFFAGAVLTAFFALHHLLFYVWGVWMLCYGLAICAVGLFSVRPVSYLGAAFVLAGAVTLFLSVPYHLYMMALTFGGFHIAYGLWTARRDGW
ncbi:MAG: hypothetical protein JO250_24770 [Armatimonadetes bacterium]|nr:hypothetical protein [Armatimonadota bacterium]